MTESETPPQFTESQMITLIGCLERTLFMVTSAKQAMYHVQGARGQVPTAAPEYLAHLALSLRTAANSISIVVNEISGEQLDANDVISSIEEMLDGKEPK